MKTLAICNQKGGVGKTTTVVNLAACLVSRGNRVLVVDLDPQACLGAALGAPEAPPERSMLAVLAGEAELAGVLVDLRGVTLGPAGDNLAEAELKLLGAPDALLALREALEPVAGRFDWCILDCPPSLGMLTLAALTAADEVLVPMQAEFLALRRLAAVFNTVERIRRRLNRGLKVAGILPTMVDARLLHSREVLEKARTSLPWVRFFAAVPRSIRFAEGPVAAESIMELAPGSEGAAAYNALAEALEGR